MYVSIGTLVIATVLGENLTKFDPDPDGTNLYEHLVFNGPVYTEESKFTPMCTNECCARGGLTPGIGLDSLATTLKSRPQQIKVLVIANSVGKKWRSALKKVRNKISASLGFETNWTLHNIYKGGGSPYTVTFRLNLLMEKLKSKFDYDLVLLHSTKFFVESLNENVLRNLIDKSVKKARDPTVIVVRHCKHYELPRTWHSFNFGDLAVSKYYNVPVLNTCEVLENSVANSCFDGKNLPLNILYGKNGTDDRHFSARGMDLIASSFSTNMARLVTDDAYLRSHTIPRGPLPSKSNVSTAVPRVPMFYEDVNSGTMVPLLMDGFEKVTHSGEKSVFTAKRPGAWMILKTPARTSKVELQAYTHPILPMGEIHVHVVQPDKNGRYVPVIREGKKPKVINTCCMNAGGCLIDGEYKDPTQGIIQDIVAWTREDRPRLLDHQRYVNTLYLNISAQMNTQPCKVSSEKGFKVDIYGWLGTWLTKNDAYAPG